MITLTSDSVLAALEEIVAEVGPDYRYEKPLRTPRGELLADDVLGGAAAASCYYVHTPLMRGEETGVPEPACLIGRLLVRLGVSVSDLAVMEGAITKGSPTAPAALAFLRDAGVITYDTVPGADPIPALLRRIQRRQDQGQTWEEALRLGRETPIGGMYDI